MTLARTQAVLERQREEGLHQAACLVASIDAEPAGHVELGGWSSATEFPWMSITKIATALRVVMAWDRGRLSLDQPAFGKSEVTVRHLLTHTAGTLVADRTEPLPDWAEDVARVASTPLVDGWVPGRDAGYSTRSGYLLLAETCRSALGDDRSWDVIVEDDVLRPLKMDSSRMTPAPGERCHPGSSGVGPIGEVLRLLECLYLGGTPLLSPPAAEAMVARHRSGLKDRTFGAVLDWGLGVIIDSKVHSRGGIVPYGYGPHAGPRTYGHGGAQSSGAMCDPDAGLVAAVVFDGQPGDAKHSRRVHEVWSALYEDLGLV